MNIEQTIKYLEDSKCDQKQGEVFQEMHNEALNIAIQALEKQIPKRPHHNYTINEDIYAECPNCGHTGLKKGTHGCCWWCGQKLDWGEDVIR